MGKWYYQLKHGSFTYLKGLLQGLFRGKDGGQIGLSKPQPAGTILGEGMV